jgi:hypothetical protein
MTAASDLKKIQKKSLLRKRELWIEDMIANNQRQLVA